MAASTSVRTEVTEPALTDLLAEIAEMRDKPVPENELMDAKRAIVAGFALSLENPTQVLGYYVQNWLYGLPADYWDTYPAKINAVTAAQAQAAAAKYLGRVEAADRRRRRRRQDHRDPEEEGHARDVRRRGKPVK